MSTNYIAPMWRMPRNTNKDKLSNYSINFNGSTDYIDCGSPSLFDDLTSLSVHVRILPNYMHNHRCL